MSFVFCKVILLEQREIRDIAIFFVYLCVTLPKVEMISYQGIIFVRGGI